MKKATLIAVACAMFVGAQSLVAQEPNEGVTYVSDPEQGVLFNRMQDNWFLTAEGGANIYFAKYTSHRDLADRFAPNAGLYVGKWFSPVFGGRLGVNWTKRKSLADDSKWAGTLKNEYKPDGFTKQVTNAIGPTFDLMISLTNWWCGYKPGRVYNSIIYVGAGAAWNLDDDWENLHNMTPFLRGGWINSFNVSEQVALSLDIRWTGYDAVQNYGNAGWNRVYHDLSASLGLTYKFKNREWSAPVVPVCPEPENCDALRAQLSRANERIDQLERALRDCLNRPVEGNTVVEQNGPIATVYYPIGVSTLDSQNKRVVKAVANQMNSDNYSGKNFVLTGWADNNTGSEAVNVRLRAKRAEGVRDLLVNNGVDESRLSIVENNGNRLGDGEEYISLNRAVTIEEAK